MAIVLASVAYLIYWRIDTGLKMDQEELQACGAGNATICLRGVERYGFSDTRAEMYQAAYFNATGKTLPTMGRAIKDYGKAQVEELSTGGIRVRFKDTSITVDKAAE